MDFTDIRGDLAETKKKDKESLLKPDFKQMDKHSEKAAYLAAQMKDLLAVLQRTPGYKAGSESKECMDHEGYAKKVGKIRSKLKTYYFVLRGIQLAYYVNKDDKVPKGIYTVSFSRIDKLNVKKEELEGADPEYAAFMESQMSSHRIILYSPDRVHNLVFELEEDAIKWQTILSKNLRAVLGDAEFETKEAAAKSMEPLIKSESEDQYLIYKNLVSILVSTGMIIAESPLTSKSKVKEGYLHLRKDDPVTKGHNWKRYYFVMVGTTIYYYTSTTNAQSDGIITLKYCNIDVDESYCAKQKWVFKVQTPLRTYYLRAKHDGSMKEWLKVIDAVCPSSNGEILWKKFDSLRVVKSEDEIKQEAEPVKGNKVLAITVSTAKGAKNMSVKLKAKHVYKIGRDSANEIVVDDECVSRSHLKIEVTADDRVVATDMGSSRGTKVNGEKITCQALSADDKIEIGNTLIILHVK